MTTIAPPSTAVAAILRRAQQMGADGRNTTKEVSGLVAEIGKLSEEQRTELFDTFDAVKQQAGAPRGREALEVFLGAVRDSPARLLSRLEKDDGVIDLKDALTAFATLGAGQPLTGKQKTSVFTMLLVAKTTPEAREALLAATQGKSIDIDSTIRPLLQRGNVTADEVKALQTGAGRDAYGAYQLNYWAMVARPSQFAPGGHEALQAAAEQTYHLVPRSYREDLELNRSRPTTPRTGLVLQRMAQEALGVNAQVSVENGRVNVEVGQARYAFERNDDAAAFLLELALKSRGHAIDSVRYQPSESGGRYVVKKGSVEETAVFHSELMRRFRLE